MLLSVQELQGYAIHARDGDLGTVRTFSANQKGDARWYGYGSRDYQHG